ncbi:MAG: Xaa-Pro aminopeptidase [Actinomycetia bacterium]|nr:Xaa-Pro aminopeptidase [Actinomycetes bacterium]
MTAPDLTRLPPMRTGARIGRLRDAMESTTDVDALLVTRMPNIRYLTGFTGSAGVVLVTRDEVVFVTDGRYRTQAAEQLDAAGVDARVAITATGSNQREILAGALAEAGAPRLGLEAHGVTWAQQRTFAEWFPGSELVPTEHVVEGLRIIKEPEEIARIRAACAVADDALAELLPLLAERPTEQEFAIALERAMRDRGASGNSFDPIVAAGPNGAKPHARPSTRPIERGELVVIDFGCIVDGYCSDMTRTVSVGEPTSEARHMWDVVVESQQLGRDAVREGVTAAAVDEACREVIVAAGWGEAFAHGTGHGVGLEIHEDPRVAATSSATLAVGHVVTVEPGVYLPGIGGVRIEDTLVVTDSGSDPLTLAPKVLVL